MSVHHLMAVADSERDVSGRLPGYQATGHRRQVRRAGSRIRHGRQDPDADTHDHQEDERRPRRVSTTAGPVGGDRQRRGQRADRSAAERGGSGDRSAAERSGGGRHGFGTELANAETSEQIGFDAVELRGDRMVCRLAAGSRHLLRRRDSGPEVGEAL
jgi:hypothetical protein